MTQSPSHARAVAQIDEIMHWLATYTEEIALLRKLMLSDAPSLRARYTIAGVLNYQLKKMDLAPDWIPLLGMMDDAIVLRVGAAVFLINNLEPLPPEHERVISRLNEQNEMAKEILGPLYDALFQRVRGLIEQRVHGRTPKEILGEEDTRQRFLAEMDSFVERFTLPEIEDPEDLLAKLQSYFKAKLA